MLLSACPTKSRALVTFPPHFGKKSFIISTFSSRQPSSIGGGGSGGAHYIIFPRLMRHCMGLGGEVSCRGGVGAVLRRLRRSAAGESSFCKT